MKRLFQGFLILAFVAWMAGWFWAFSFQYSSSFFQHHLDTRLPFLFLSLLEVAVAPLSGYWAVTRTLLGRVGGIRAACVHAAATAAPVVLFWCVYTLWLTLSRRAGRIAFEADEAMGIGIDFMLSVGVFLLSNIVVASVLILSKVRRSKRPQG